MVGTACGLGIEGSGWVAAPGLVVTNAHVVAGETDTVVQIGGVAPGLPARVVVFDPHDDIAVLRVPGPQRAAPSSWRPTPGRARAAAILGYPLDGPFDAEPGRLGQTQVVNTEDAYGNGPVQRSITSLRGRVRPGNSGGPMVDAGGRVVATVFAAITGARQRRAAASRCPTRWSALSWGSRRRAPTRSAPRAARGSVRRGVQAGRRA